MDSGNAIEVQNIKKDFKVFYDKGFQLKERLLFRKRNKYERREVLKGISFNVRKGESVGLIGKNGCGKSTILKIINRILYPDSGMVSVKGRVSSLIELGAGFHPDMSGMENIYTNASIFGLTKKEIDKRLEQIITFSELEKFIGNPVRTYSSGMYMRLAFSVAINVDADILLIDEILGVGDVSFQEKCFQKLLDIKERGTTVVIVSHSLQQIEKICDRSIWIEDGFIRESGKPLLIHEKYKKNMAEKHQERLKAEAERTVTLEPKQDLPFFCCKDARRYGNLKMEFGDIVLQTENGEIRNEFSRDENIVIQYKLITKSLNENINVAFRIIREDGITCFASDYVTMQVRTNGIVSYLQLRDENIGEIVIDNKKKLIEGLYYLDMIITREGVEVYDEICRAKEFRVKGAASGIGVCEMNVKWLMSEEQENGKNNHI